MTKSPHDTPATKGGECTYEAFRASRLFSCLDGLRALAILAVIWHHTGIVIEGVRLTRQGHLGVDLFFALSGFLITTLLIRERERFGHISLSAFYIRRALRIFPLYYAVIAVYIAAVVLLERDAAMRQQFFSNLPYYLTYTSNWFVQLDGRVIFYFAWSLATEEQFYLVWPSIERSLRGWRVAAVIIAVLLLRTAVQSAADSGIIERSCLAVTIALSIHPAILGGALLAHVLHDERGFRATQLWLGARWSSPAVLAALIVGIEVGLMTEIIWLLMVLLVGAVSICESNSLGPVLRWRPISHIGLVSYGMYLMHMLCYNVVKQALPPLGVDNRWILFVVTAGTTTLAATLSFRYFESWFLRLKERYTLYPTRGPVASS